MIVYWRDIPAQVVVRSGRASARRELPARFSEAIDRAAMRAGLTGTQTYLDHWRRGEPADCGPDLEAAASAAATVLEEAYPPARLKALAERNGAEA